jgi:hypothetical protein
MVRSVDFLYSLYDALVSVNVPSDKARAVVDAMERDMATHLATKPDVESLRAATKSDFALLRQEMTSGFASLRQGVAAEFAAVRREMTAEFAAVRQEARSEIELLRSSMTIRLGSMLVVGLSLLFAALKLT